MRDRLKVTSVVVTHDMRSARRIGQRILMLHDQRIYATRRRMNSSNRKTRSCASSWTGLRIPKNFTFNMNKSRLEWKVGLFVFIGLALLAVLLLQFSKGMTFFRPTYDILLHAPTRRRPEGARPGADVRRPGGHGLGISSPRTGRTSPLPCAFTSDMRFTRTRGLSSSNPAFWATSTWPLCRPGTRENPRQRREAKAEAPFDLQELARSAAGFVLQIDSAATNSTRP